VIVTEEEAKTKWCPEARVFKSAGVPLSRSAAVNRWSDDAEQINKTNCLGSGCMAWRWFREATSDEWEKVVPHPDDMKRYFLAGYEEDPNHRGAMRKKISNAMPAFGYCGKAGKP